MAPVNRKNPIRAASSESDYSLMEFMAEFPNDDACLDWLWRNRYSTDGLHAHCPKCEQEREFGRYATKQQRQSWTCTACGHHLHPTAGSIFHKSSTSLHLWFYAMHLMTSTRCGISAKQLERELGVTYKTAWFMAHRIHEAMRSNDLAPMGGAGSTVEADETFIGRKDGTIKRRGHGHKNAVLSLIDRNSKQARSFHVEGTSAADIIPIIKANVAKETAMMTDEGGHYFTLGDYFASHESVSHKADEYVRGDVTTNTVEGFFGIFKRGMTGVYQHCGENHLQAYLNEFDFRYSNRIALGVNDGTHSPRNQGRGRQAIDI